MNSRLIEPNVIVISAIYFRGRIISAFKQVLSVGVVADNFDERIIQKVFYTAIVVDHNKVATATSMNAPQILSLKNESGINNMKEIMVPVTNK